MERQLFRVQTLQGGREGEGGGRERGGGREGEREGREEIMALPSFMRSWKTQKLKSITGTFSRERLSNRFAMNRGLLRRQELNPPLHFRKHSLSATYYLYAWTAVATNTVEVPVEVGAVFGVA